MIARGPAVAGGILRTGEWRGEEGNTTEQTASPAPLRDVKHLEALDMLPGACGRCTMSN